MDWLQKAIFVFVFFIFDVQNVKSVNFNPKCIPKQQTDQNGTHIDYIFILDHSLEQEKIDKMRYVMKAASCDIPNGQQYRLKTIHFISEGNVKSSGFKNSLEFPDTLQEQLRTDAVSKAACHRLLQVLDEIGAATDSGAISYLVMPFDAKEDCHPHELFDASNSNPQRHLTLINMDGAPKSNRITDMNLEWAKIDLKKEDLHKSKKFSELQEAGEIMETVAKWVQKTFDLSMLDRKTMDTTNTTYAAQFAATSTESGQEKSVNSTMDYVTNEASTNPMTRSEQSSNQTTAVGSDGVTDKSGANTTNEENTTVVNVATVAVNGSTNFSSTEVPELSNSTEKVKTTTEDSVNSTTNLDTVDSTDVTRMDTFFNDTLILPVVNGSLDNSTTTEARHIQNSTVPVTIIDKNSTVFSNSSYGQETSTVSSIVDVNTTINGTVVTRIDTLSNATVTQLNMNSTNNTIHNSIVIQNRVHFFKGLGWMNTSSSQLPSSSVTPVMLKSTTEAAEEQNNLAQANALQMDTSTKTEEEEEAAWYGNWNILFGLIILLLLLLLLVIIFVICCITNKKKGQYQLVEEPTQRSPPVTSKPTGISYSPKQDENGYEIVNHAEMQEDETMNSAPALEPLITPLADPQVQSKKNQTNLAPTAPLLPPRPPAPRAPEGVMDPFSDAPVNQYFVNYKPIEVTPVAQQTPTERSQKQEAIAEPSGLVKKYDIGGAVDEMF